MKKTKVEFVDVTAYARYELRLAKAAFRVAQQNYNKAKREKAREAARRKMKAGLSS